MRSLAFCKTLFTVVSLVVVSACEKTVINRGYSINEEDFNSIKIGTDTVHNVFAKLGSPTLRSSVLDKTGGYRWFYSGKQMTKFGFTEPKTVRTDTYVITFNSSDVVTSVNRISEETAIPVEMDTVTDKSGKTKGAINELFGGMGRYIDAYSKER